MLRRLFWPGLVMLACSSASGPPVIDSVSFVANGKDASGNYLYNGVIGAHSPGSSITHFLAHVPAQNGVSSGYFSITVPPRAQPPFNVSVGFSAGYPSATYDVDITAVNAAEVQSAVFPTTITVP